MEKLMNSDEGGYAGPRIDCGRGHEAEFVEYRRKGILTVLAGVEVERAYYYCQSCGGGILPKDEELDIVGTCFSKGPSGRGKTREAKLACVFTQTKGDEEGHPVRDPESTTYVGAIGVPTGYCPARFRSVSKFSSLTIPRPRSNRANSVVAQVGPGGRVFGEDGFSSRV